ncbi:hypothetical protein [Vibrio alginolyticus]|uniref:hypothetical protein n=1 Tax=Vibrio alginolyticus TaxID=663 RepID=UPI0015F4D7AE|nr:hypothetical protein [Vibrio alginolyticus]EJE4208772.1 hypothetical protein [Vibrio parahaemolyticus]
MKKAIKKNFSTGDWAIMLLGAFIFQFLPSNVELTLALVLLRALVGSIVGVGVFQLLRTIF